ncbi:MAG: hypothetical protein PHX45_08100 [Acidobacteriota bacterium]|nr:hypothetical protein [Acidobacteriota bacterium]
MSDKLSRRRFLQAGGLVAAASALRAGTRESHGAPDPESGENSAAAPSLPAAGLNLKGLFLHAWDLRDDGVDTVMGWMRDSGLNTMQLAGTYHSGWFLHPQNSRHRAFMTEGSRCYFHPHEEFYKGTSLKPLPSAVSKETDWFAEAGRRLDSHGLRLVSWTVGTHNTHLGLAHPEHAQRNVYGDSLPHALCPADDDVREYLKALCRDLAASYPMWGILAESFGWSGQAHGHHHERDLVGLTPLERQLAALCFCPSCRRKAAGAGVDMEETRRTVKATLDAAFRDAPDRPAGHPRTMADLEEKSRELGRFNDWRRLTAEALIMDIRRESLKNTDCRLIMLGGYQAGLAAAADGFSCMAYGKSAAETMGICAEFRGQVPSSWKGALTCHIRLGMGRPKDAAELRAIVQAVRQSGCNGIGFYSRSESPPRMLSWIKSSLREL